MRRAVNSVECGFVEGFNNKLKVIKRRCYGILNVTHLGLDHRAGHFRPLRIIA